MVRKPEVLAKKLDLFFGDFSFFVMALTHRSAGSNNNERLEFLGDSILGFVIADKVYSLFPKASEGELSRLRASLVNQTSLAELAREYNIGDYLILGSGELKSGGYRRDSILSDALEAIMGAILKDQGTERCHAWILSLFAKKLEKLDIKKSQKDPKTKLQELMQSRKIELPVYTLIKMTGVAHNQQFNIKCSTVLDIDPCFGTGVSRKRAEQSAAEKMLKLIQRKIK